MPKIELLNVPIKTGSLYPAPFDSQMTGRRALQVGKAGGLTQFGANIVILEPGARSSLRHWHRDEDEFVMVTEGAVTLIDDHGTHDMAAGDCAAFPAGEANGHCFENRSDAEARLLVVGTNTPDEAATYSDVDLQVTNQDGTAVFTRKDGRPYTQESDDG